VNKIVKYIIGIIAVVVILLQFMGPDAPDNRENNPDDLLMNTQVDAEVAGLLRASCYDCHSMETKYPWYSKISPVSGFLFDHIEEGRDELNFSNWQTYEKRRKLRKLKEIQEEIEEGEMPMKSYTLVHGEARLSDSQKELIINWAKDYSKKVFSE